MIEPFKNLIHDFGIQLNATGIEANERGYLAVRFDSQTVHLQYDEELDEIVVFTRLVDVEPNRMTEISLMLLGANKLWQGTKGATFSVDPNSKTIMLADRRALSSFNVSQLNDWLEQFLNVAQYWNERLTVANKGMSESNNFNNAHINHWMWMQ